MGAGKSGAAHSGHSTFPAGDCHEADEGHEEPIERGTRGTQAILPIVNTLDLTLLVLVEILKTPAE
jgi:hypothetical protein